MDRSRSMDERMLTSDWRTLDPLVVRLQGDFEVTEPPNFGNFATGDIHGYKWHDVDGNGAWDPGEPGLNGWTIYLDLNNSGDLDAGDECGRFGDRDGFER